MQDKAIKRFSDFIQVKKYDEHDRDFKIMVIKLTNEVKWMMYEKLRISTKRQKCILKCKTGVLELKHFI